MKQIVKEEEKGESLSKSTRVSTIVLVAFAITIFMVAPAIAGTVSYDYDDAGRLVKADYGNGTAIEYEYDSAGNLLAVNVTAWVLNCTCGDICVNETGWWRDGGDFNPCLEPIWAAVNSSAVGETICVKDGAYNENVDVNKRLTIRSENGSASTIVNASDSNDHVFNVTANWVNISGFTVQNATKLTYPQTAGIYLGNGVEHCNISGNNATNNYFGICLWSSDNNNITNNTCNLNNHCGILLSNADDNNITCNWVQNNTDAGFYLTNGSIGNTIGQNNIIANGALQGNGSYHWQFNNDQSNPVEAKNNYWGAGMNNSTIDASIRDDEEGKGTVTFLPKLDGPAPCAPIHEAATIILLAVGLLMLAGYVRIGRNK